MCLGIPMQVKEINGFNARCEAKGIERTVSLFMMQDEDIQVGDNLMIHVGYAIQKITPQDAQTTWDLYDEMFTIMDQGMVEKNA
jgi:hydrogenase expression/formation protein HypC